MPKILKIIFVLRIPQVCNFTLIKSKIIPILNKIFMSFCLPLPTKIVKQLYKFCNTLIPGQAGQNKKFAGRAGNFGAVDTSSIKYKFSI